MKIKGYEFSTYRYFRSRGTYPSGFGLWFFEDESGENILHAQGTLSEARAAVARQAHAEGVLIGTRFHVAP